MNQDAEAAIRRREQINRLYHQAVTAYKSQDWVEAAQKLHALLQLEPTHHQAQLLLRQLLQISSSSPPFLLGQETNEQSDDLADSPEADIPPAPPSLSLDTVATLLREAQAAASREDWTTAISSLRAVLRQEPKNAEAAAILLTIRQRARLAVLYQRGQMHFEAGRWEQALPYFREVQNIDHRYKLVSTRLPVLEQFVQRQAEQRRIMTFYRQLQGALYVQARDHYQAGRLPESLVCLREIQETEGTNQNIERLVQVIEHQMERESDNAPPSSPPFWWRSRYWISGLFLAGLISILGWLLIDTLSVFRQSPLTTAVSPPNQPRNIPIAHITFTPPPPPSPTAPSPTATPPPSPVPSATPASSPTTTPSCRIVSPALNLRYGPGKIYAPPLSKVQRGTLLFPLARDPAGQWLYVRVAETARQGWISAAPAFVSCTISIDNLPIDPALQ